MQASSGSPANTLSLVRHEDEVVADFEIRLVQPQGSQLVRIVPSDQLSDEAFTHGIRDVAIQVIPAVEIQLGSQVAILRMSNLQVQVSRTKEMPTESAKHNARRTTLRDLIGRWNDRSDLEGPVRTGMEAAAQVPFRDVGMDVRVKALGVRLPHIQFDVGQRRGIGRRDAAPRPHRSAGAAHRAL